MMSSHMRRLKVFNRLNNRVCAIPVGEILVEVKVTHPLLYVSATAVALPVWDAHGYHLKDTKYQL